MPGGLTPAALAMAALAGLGQKATGREEEGTRGYLSLVRFEWSTPGTSGRPGAMPATRSAAAGLGLRWRQR